MSVPGHGDLSVRNRRDEMRIKTKSARDTEISRSFLKTRPRRFAKIEPDLRPHPPTHPPRRSFPLGYTIHRFYFVWWYIYRLYVTTGENFLCSFQTDLSVRASRIRCNDACDFACRFARKRGLTHTRLTRIENVYSCFIADTVAVAEIRRIRLKVIAAGTGLHGDDSPRSPDFTHFLSFRLENVTMPVGKFRCRSFRYDANALLYSFTLYN